MASTHDLTPNGSTETLNWSANPHLATDDPPGSPDDAATVTQNTSTSATCRMRLSLTAMANLSQVNRITLHTNFKGQTGQGAGVQVKPFIYTSAAYYYGTTVVAPNSAVYIDRTNEWLVNPATSAPWTKTELDGLEAGVEYIPTSDADDAVFVTQAYVRVEFVAAPVRLEASRFLASAELNLFRRVQGVVKVPAPERYADIPILGDVDLVHLALPTTEASYGRKPWQRHRAIKLAESVDLNNPASPLVLTLLLTRHVRVAEWDTMETEKAPSTFMDGVARLSSGASRSFSRASKAWVPNPAAAAQGSLQVVEVQLDQEALTTGGTLLEAAATNIVRNMNFNLGVSSQWTPTAATNDTADLVWDSGVSVQSCKLTRPGAGNARITQSNSMTASTAYTLSVTHKDDSGVKLQVALIRDSDGFYWQGGSSWLAGVALFDLPVRTTAERDYIGPITKDGATNAVTLHIRAESVNDQINHVYDAQIETGNYATSRIHTTTASATRALADLRIANDHGKRVFSGERDEPVTTFLEFNSEWDSSALAAGATRFLDMVYFNADNYVRLIYNQATLAFALRVRAAGVNMTNSRPTTVTRGTWIKLAWRLTSTALEYGLAAHTVDLWVDGVKSAGTVVSGPFGALPSATTRYVGQDETTASQADGIIRRRRTVFAALSDQEIVGEMEA
jgi:hypothetical protein